MAIRLFDEQGNTEKTGCVSHQIAWHVDNLQEVVGPLPSPGFNLPENFGKRRWKKWQIGYIVNAIYEGVFEETDPTKVEVGFYPSFKEAKLQTHPRFQQLLTKYGGSYDPFTNVITWQQQAPNGSGGSGGFAAGGAVNQVNVMFGQDSYIELAVVFRRTRIYSQVPVGALQLMAKIMSQLPAEGAGMPTPNGRNWFVMPPTIERRGNVWTFADEWLLSPPGQVWNPDVYDFIVS